LLIGLSNGDIGVSQSALWSPQHSKLAKCDHQYPDKKPSSPTTDHAIPIKVEEAPGTAFKGGRAFWQNQIADILLT